MAKVILITSREIVEEKSNVLAFRNLVFQRIGGGIESNNFYCELFVSEPFPKLLQLSDEAKGNLLNSARTNATVSIEKLIEMIKTDVISKIKNKGGSNFVFGIFRKALSNVEDTKVYFANEFPDFGERAHDEDKFRYLNNILEEICAQEKINCNEADWEFFSHDLDWGSKGIGNCCLTESTATKTVKDYYEERKNKIVNANNYPTLMSIIRKTSTQIHLFQHDMLNDATFLYVKYLINEDTVPRFEKFQEQGATQKLAFKNYIQDPNNDSNWEKLMAIDSKYPFMPFDLVENPLKQQSKK